MIEDGEQENIGKKKKSKNSQGEDPSTCKGRSHQVKRWRVQKKRKEEKWKKRKKKKKKKKVKYSRRRWWKK